MTQRLDIDQPFDLDAVLDGTQDFRWRPWECDWHSGVLNGNLIHIRQVSGGVEYRAAAELDALVRSYFRLDDNIPAMRAELSARDRNVARLLNKYPHLRVLRQQDPWECMVSYICSATNVKGGGILGHGVSLSSENVLANWPAEMSHSLHGECDIESQRTGETSGSEQSAG